jgi:hypothetical protein
MVTLRLLAFRCLNFKYEVYMMDSYHTIEILA